MLQRGKTEVLERADSMAGLNCRVNDRKTVGVYFTRYCF